MPVVIDGSVGISQAEEFDSNSTFGFKNRIINGDMRIDQRNAGAAQNSLGANYTYLVDRFAYYGNAASKFDSQQNAGSVTPPTGFANYLGLTVASAVTVSTTDQYLLKQSIEGFNTADLAWGTSSASTVTLSFWVRSSLTGTFAVALKNSAGNRSYVASYTITSANTWEQKIITVPGDTSGTWIGSTNGVGINIWWNLGAGSTYSTATANAWQGSDFQNITGSTQVVGTNGATFYITGVQLEKGSTATSFEFRSIGQELALCQRYFLKYGDTNVQALAGGGMISTTEFLGYIGFPQEMRATPTLTTSGTFDVRTSAGLTVSAVTFSGGKLSGQISATTSSGTSGAGGVLRVASGGTLLFSSEL